MPDALPDLSLFDGFDPAEVAAIVAAQLEAERPEGSARAIRAAHRAQLRRANSEAHLAEILPARLGDGESVHCISRGDVDALSFLAHWIKHTHFDRVLISTWCMAKDDLDRLTGWLDSGRIDQLELYVGEIFPGQYGDEYEAALRLADVYGTRLVVARNHSKVMLAAHEASAYYLSIESSANVNTNPRIEQTATHCGRELYAFYLDFFHGLRSIDRRAP